MPQNSKTEEVDSQGNEFQSCKGSDGPESQRNGKDNKKKEEQKQSEAVGDPAEAEEDEWEDDGEEEYYDEEMETGHGRQGKKDKKKTNRAGQTQG